MGHALDDLVAALGDDQAQVPVRRVLVVQAPARSSLELTERAAEYKRNSTAPDSILRGETKMKKQSKTDPVTVATKHSPRWNRP